MILKGVCVVRFWGADGGDLNLNPKYLGRGPGTYVIWAYRQEACQRGCGYIPDSPNRGERVRCECVRHPMEFILWEFVF